MSAVSRSTVIFPLLCCGLLASCAAQSSGQGAEREYGELRTLVVEQRDAIAQLRREQEQLRARVDELEHDLSLAEASPGYGDALGEGYASYPGGRHPTPPVPLEPMEPLEPMDSEPLDIPYPDTPAFGSEAPSLVAPPPSAPPLSSAEAGAQPDYRSLAAVPPAEAAGDMQLPTVPDSLAGSVYEDGVRALIAGDQATAQQSFRDFIRENPGSAYLDDAQFWIGETYFRKGQYHRAIIEFNQVATAYPSGNRAPAALVRQAEVFRIVGDRVDARLSLQKVIKHYPSTPEAARATRLLGEMGG